MVCGIQFEVPLENRTTAPKKGVPSQRSIVRTCHILCSFRIHNYSCTNEMNALHVHTVIAFMGQECARLHIVAQ